MNYAQFTRDIVIESFRPKEYYYNEPLPETDSVQPALVLAKMVNLKRNLSHLTPRLWSVLSLNCGVHSGGVRAQDNVELVFIPRHADETGMA